MSNQTRRIWLRAVLLTGAIYCAIGIGFSAFAARSSSQHVAWNVASFVVSLVVFAVHIGYEHFGIGNRPVIVAWHASLAVALGSFLLAVSANINSFRVANSPHGLLAIALVVWPLMVGIPAFVVALIAAGGLHFFRRADRIAPDS
jgi:uncharacterized protein (DUF486 family)